MRTTHDVFDTPDDDGAPFIAEADTLGLYRPDAAAAARTVDVHRRRRPSPRRLTVGFTSL